MKDREAWRVAVPGVTGRDLVTEQQQLIKLVGWRGKRVLRSGCNGMLELMGLVETP